MKDARSPRKASRKTARVRARRATSAGSGPVKSAPKPRVGGRDRLSKRDRAKIERSLRKHEDAFRLLAEWDRKHPAGG